MHFVLEHGRRAESSPAVDSPGLSSLFLATRGGEKGESDDPMSEMARKEAERNRRRASGKATKGVAQSRG